MADNLLFHIDTSVIPTANWRHALAGFSSSLARQLGECGFGVSHLSYSAVLLWVSQNCHLLTRLGFIACASHIPAPHSPALLKRGSLSHLAAYEGARAATRSLMKRKQEWWTMPPGDLKAPSMPNSTRFYLGHCSAVCSHRPNDSLHLCFATFSAGVVGDKLSRCGVGG